jgi:CubicO group peptidase (beta-lactamase class C family)
MSAGFKWDDEGPELYDFVWSEDPAGYAIKRAQVNDPGTVFNYNSSISHFLSVILTKASDTNTFEFADYHLFKPLGIRQRAWSSDTQGFYYGGFGLALSARDLAKIGCRLIKEDGIWKWYGDQLQR